MLHIGKITQREEHHRLNCDNSLKIKIKIRWITGRAMLLSRTFFVIVSRTRTTCELILWIYFVRTKPTN